MLSNNAIRMKSKREASKILGELRTLQGQIAQKDEANNLLVTQLTEELTNNKVLLTRLTEEVKTLRVELSQIKKHSTVMPVEGESDLKALPLTCIEAVCSFDNDLQNNPNTKGAFVQLIERVGGTDLSQFIRNGIKRTITDELAMQYSWTGTKDKPRIREYFFISLIRGICHQKFGNSDDDKINSILQQHIVHAKDRFEKRLKRAHQLK